MNKPDIDPFEHANTVIYDQEGQLLVSLTFDLADPDLVNVVLSQVPNAVGGYMLVKSDDTITRISLEATDE